MSRTNVALAFLILCIVGLIVSTHFGSKCQPYDTTITPASKWFDSRYQRFYVSDANGQTYLLAIGRSSARAGILYGKIREGVPVKVHVANWTVMLSGQAIHVIDQVYP